MKKLHHRIILILSSVGVWLFQPANTALAFATTPTRASPKAGPPPPPDPPQELPLRFLRAGKGDPIQGQQRYEETLEWRRQEQIDTILREPFPDFALIKEHYPHYYHLKGRKGQPVYYEQPARTNLAALRKAGVTLEQLLRHYTMITEFQWQLLAPDDFMTSIFVIDLVDIRLKDFVGETVKFVKMASKLSAAHYPERAGVVFVVNVPKWFQIIWRVVRPIVDDATLKKIYILRGEDEIKKNLQEHIDLENIPPEYGGESNPLGEAPEEQMLRDLMQHNLELAKQGRSLCPNCRPKIDPSKWPCEFCKWTPPRSY